MKQTFKAHFDGRVIVPDEPVSLPVDQTLELQWDVKAPSNGRPPLADAERAYEELLAWVRSRPAHPPLPDAALDRESIYGDE